MLLAVCAGCAEASTNDELEEYTAFDSAVLAEASIDSGQSLDASFEWPDASVQLDATTSLDSSSGSADAGLDAATPRDAGADASSDAGARDAAVDASAPDAGKADASAADAATADAGTKDAGSNMCNPDDCKNSCSISAPFRCCQSDGQCGCSWVSGIYCN